MTRQTDVKLTNILETPKKQDLQEFSTQKPSKNISQQSRLSTLLIRDFLTNGKPRVFLGLTSSTMNKNWPEKLKKTLLLRSVRKKTHRKNSSTQLKSSIQYVYDLQLNLKIEVKGCAMCQRKKIKLT